MGRTDTNTQPNLLTVKRERVTRQTVSHSQPELLTVKRERSTRNRPANDNNKNPDERNEQKILDRRILRSKYRALHNKIKDERDDLTKVDSETFNSIIQEVENLHQFVQKPREQVADAEALLDITNTLVSSVKSQSNEGITPAGFISCFLNQFGECRRLHDDEDAPVSVNWRQFGAFVSPTLRQFNGMNTMLGPMSSELKQRKVTVRKRAVQPTMKSHPEEVSDTGKEKRTDTDINMQVMFDILGKKKPVRLENLILNRNSFSQTVENLFALSFLVKDGRVKIELDESGSHFVFPENAPSADSVMSGKASYKHFVFRFDFQDWELMTNVVPDGEEIMPHRRSIAASQDPEANKNTEESLPRTPIRKFSRNRGLVVQEETVVEDSPEVDDGSFRATGFRRCKRKLT